MNMDATHPNRLYGWFFRFDWLLVLLICLTALVGFVMLYSVADGSAERWALPQIKRFSVALVLCFGVAMVPMRIWYSMSWPIYVAVIVLLLGVEFFGISVSGAKRWLDFGVARIQPSELLKISLVLALARYFQTIEIKPVPDIARISVPLLIVALPAILVLRQPDLGTSLLIISGGLGIMFLAGISWRFYATLGVLATAAVTVIFMSRGSDWQILRDYQWRRIDTFLDPSSASQAAGYHITQSRIAFGAGGQFGRGFMQGSQSKLDFLPEKHTDFIFTALAEEFGLAGTMGLLGLYFLILTLLLQIYIGSKETFARLVTGGVAVFFFLYLAANMAMVTGLIPVVGVPLPLISYGGTSILTLMICFGLVQSTKVHRDTRVKPRTI